MGDTLPMPTYYEFKTHGEGLLQRGLVSQEMH